MNSFKASLLAAAVLVAVPLAVQAESETVSTGNAEAHLDFEIVIPRVLLLQIGTSGVGAIDTITFDLSGTPELVGQGPVAGTGGNLPSGGVTARVLGNNGDVTLTSSTSGVMSNGTSQISFSQITTDSDNTAFEAPALADTGTGSTVIVNDVNGVVEQEAEWTYEFANNTVVTPGTYTGQVTYTASMP